MAGMFLTALYKANRIDVRFEATNRILAASFDLGLQGYSLEGADQFLTRLRERVEAMPGVESATFTNQVPMGERLIGADVTLEGEAPGEPRRFGENAGMRAFLSDVAPDYFSVLGIPLVEGRDFTADDRRTSPAVVIVSEDFARHAWGDGGALGKRISVHGTSGPYATVVGVARSALTMGVSERQRPMVYVPQRQSAVRDVTILVRSSGNASTLAAPLRSTLREMDVAMPIYGVQTLDRYRRDRMAEARLGSTLLAIFGTLALLLGTIGVYAVMAFSVGQRTREVGVRVACGAGHSQIVRLFVWEGVRLSMIGVVIGLVLAAVAAKILTAVFLGLSMSDAVAFAAGALVLLTAGMLATFFPAWRAARHDPIAALKAD
jgi:predicted permease